MLQIQIMKLWIKATLDPFEGLYSAPKGMFSLPNFACVLTSSRAIVLKGRVGAEFGRPFRRKIEGDTVIHTYTFY